MRVLIISDITLEPLSRKQFLHSKISYNFIFSEDLVYELDSFDRFGEYDYFYIHFDAYFKKYKQEYVVLILCSILRLSERTIKAVTLSNILDIGWSEVPFLDSTGSCSDFYAIFNEKIKMLQARANISFLDIDGLVLEVGRAQTYNFLLGHAYQLPYTKPFLDKFAFYLDSYFFKISTPDKKVIILDCDNTLWKGIIGEDGVDGVACDLNEDGILYYHFQQFLLSRKSIGFILCICSKNNEDDVKDVFKQKRMPLQWEDFVVKKVNWVNKDLNIREISEELNMGTDSFIYIDDSDFELAIVRGSLPDVSLFKMTDVYSDFIDLTKNVLFQKKNITKDDLNKTEQYLTEAKRKNLEKHSSSFEDYIKSLEIQMKIEEDSENDFARISQLTEKTNQFNFNKKFYSVEELKDMISKKSMKCFTLRVSDKFGDYGLVGVILIEVNQHIFILDNYILSCRILGRRIEFDFLNYVRNRIHEIYNAEINEIRFSKTAKNIPAQNFYNHIIQSK